MPSPLARAEAAWATQPDPPTCQCGHEHDGECAECGCTDFTPVDPDELDADHGYDLVKDGDW